MLLVSCYQNFFMHQGYQAGLSSLSTEKISNDSKYRKSARALLSAMTLANKLEDLLLVIAENKEPKSTSRQLKVASTLCVAMLQTLTPATHEAM